MEPARPSLRENLRSLPPAAWVLFGGTFVNRLGTFVMPFMTLYLTHRGFSVPKAGLEQKMYGVGGVAAQFLGGWLADRIGRRNAIGFSMLGASVITLLLWQASGLLVIYALMLLLALVAEMHRPAASALIADLVPSDQRRVGVRAHARRHPRRSVVRPPVRRRRRHIRRVRRDLADRTAARDADLTAPGTPSPGRDTDDPRRSWVPAVPGLGPDRCVHLHAERVHLPTPRPSGRLLHVRVRRAPGVERRDRRPARAADHLVDRAAIANAHDRAGHRAHRPVLRVPDRRPIDPGSRGDGARVDARRDHRLTGVERVRRGSLPRAHPGAVPGLPRRDVRARGRGRAHPRDPHLRAQPRRPVDRLWRRGRARRRSRPRGRPPPGPDVEG